MKNVNIVSKVVARKGEALASPSKDASTVNLSDFLLKSIWDKVFEFRTDSQGTEYIFGKLPMVTQYGITMYSGDGVNVPSLASGLPFDGRTIWYNPDTQQIEVIGGTGGGSGEGVSNFWDLSGIPSWITNSKPKYSYSEIEGTPDLTKYALASQIPSLSGYATESWVTKQNYATKATTLSGYGITDAYTKTNVDDLLKAYVTLSGSQTITGEKNFVGGLKVNGSPIYYDSTKKYWKLEGDLLVTGGVTMYGSDSSFTPSTIMDAIAVDGTTISKSGGVLKVIGGTGGGVADSVAWANITGKPTWIGSSKPIYSYSEITGAISTTELQNYLTSNSYINVTSGDSRYLKLSGGTLSSNSRSPLTLKSGSAENHSLLLFNRGSDYWGSIGFNASNSLIFKDTNGANYIIWNGSNFSPSDYLPLSGGTIVGNTNPLTLRCQSGTFVRQLFQLGNNTVSGIGKTDTYTFLTNYVNGSISTEIHLHDDGNFTIYSNNVLSTIWHSGNDGSGSGLDADLLDGYHAMDFTKTINRSVDDFLNFTNKARFQAAYLSGQGDFCSLVIPTWASNREDNWYLSELRFANGGNPKIRMSHNGSVTSDWREFAFTDSNVASATKLQTARTIWGQSFDGTGNVTGNLNLGYNRLYIGNGTDNFFIAMGADNMYVYNNYYGHYFTSRSGEIIRFDGSGNVGIGTINPVCKLDVNGGARFGSLTPADGLGVIPFAVANSSYANTGWCASFGTEKGGVLLGYQNSKGIAIIGASKTENICICPDGGNVGIGTTNPTTKFDINGKSMEIGTGIYGSGGVGSEIYMSTHREGSTLCARGMRMYVSGSATGYFQSFAIDAKNYGTLTNIMSINSSGNLLVVGGITMYSDQRKKTILNHVELSLKQISNAPLIEHYYNNDEKKTTHVGSIAQYWAKMNDWFCKLDSEGYYTMEIQNAALASAISIARELDRYETKTDKAIKKLKKRICELEEEVERLKSA